MFAANHFRNLSSISFFNLHVEIRGKECISWVQFLLFISPLRDFFSFYTPVLCFGWLNYTGTRGSANSHLLENTVSSRGTWNSDKNKGAAIVASLQQSHVGLG